MPNHSESSESSGAVPAGTRTNVEKRRLSRRLAEAAKSPAGYWYRVGTMMMKWNLTGPEAKKTLERDGNVVHWRTEYLRAMRRTAESVVSSGVSDQRASQCPFQFMKDVMRHYRNDKITEEEASILINRRCRHIGPARGLSLNSIRSEHEVRQVLKSIDHTTQDDQ